MFENRHHTKELLDGENIPHTELELNLKELHTINTYLGGYNTSLKALKKVISPKKPTVVVDIGSGGGDTVLQLRKWGLEKSYNIQIRGVDINPDCISYSSRRCEGMPGIQFICDDFRNVKYHVPEIDVIHAALFCHHLSDEEILHLLNFAKENSITLVINDLQRHPLAYFSIRFLTRFFSRSYLVKNDAPLSVLRGFTRSEWIALMKRAQIKKYSIRNQWAFRHQIIVYND